MGRPDATAPDAAAPDAPLPDCITPPVVERFEPELQWSWDAPDGSRGAQVTPIVGNLTDDDGSGTVDARDTPDVIVVTITEGGGTLWVVDGATGDVHFRVRDVETITPALGDIDGDGRAEIVTQDVSLNLLVVHGDGSVDVHGSRTGTYLLAAARGMTIANLDAEGLPEIIGFGSVYDASGKERWKLTVPPYSESVAADLDGDGRMEVLVGRDAYRSDGSVYFKHRPDNAEEPGWATPLVANLDTDGAPEILVTAVGSDSLLAAEGTVERRFDNDAPIGFPSFVTDLDGDGRADLGIPHGTTLDILRSDGSRSWSAPTRDNGTAGATAFDFLGSGRPQVVLADTEALRVWDFEGKLLFEARLPSTTAMQYPVVADIDNDGAAELLVVSDTSPIVRAFRDRADRWMPARSIWNQSSYHVSNVNDDGTIPVREQAHWQTHNTFRVQARGCRRAR